MTDIRQYVARHGLVRSDDHRLLGGVCAGLGRRLGLSPWTARLVFVLALMVVPGSQILVYPLLWILMPTEESVRRHALAQTQTQTRTSQASVATTS